MIQILCIVATIALLLAVTFMQAVVEQRKAKRAARRVHLIEAKDYSYSSERYEAFAYCGESRELSGSGKHPNMASLPHQSTCPKCVAAYNRRNP